ncbi:MAG: pyridoxal phosphate-dependent aminotransferase [Deltaproteobacteria bacterium]|nr:pyridoxal phosphate-dependent aminotransferase [Deltaproteobacteria bacterium]
MPLTLSKRLDAVIPSATLAINARAQALRAQGVDVISFGAGEPDFDTPANIREAAKIAIDQGKTRYTPVSGIAELRRAIARANETDRGVVTAAENVVVSVGAKSSLFNFALAALEPGDEVIIPAPYWVSYPEQVRIAGATPVHIPSTLEAGWKITAEQLEQAITDKTKAVILCTPSNPTGAAYTVEQLTSFARVLRDKQCWIVCDEIYGKLVYDGFIQRSLLAVAPDLVDRTVIIDGVSKTYAMTGWRIGWSIAPVHLSKAMDTIQGQGTSSASTPAQYAALEAISAPPTELENMQKIFAERRNRLVAGLRALPGVRCAMPEGAFYAFCDVRSWLGKSSGDQRLESDDDVARWLLDTARIAVVPGGAFGAPGHLRLSYAVSLGHIEDALQRMANAYATLR